MASGRESNEADQKWWVPLTHTYPGGDFENTYSKDWISPEDSSKKLSGMPSGNTPVIFNVQETG